MTSQGEARHTDVGAYALGLLGDAEATRFESHLAECERCGDELEAMLGLGEALAQVPSEAVRAAHPVPAPEPRGGAARDPEPLERLLARTARQRRRTRRRTWLAAAAVAVLAAVGGATLPRVVLADDDPGDSSGVTRAESARQAFERGERFSTVDPETRVEAAVSLERRPWGTQVTLRLGNLRGPRTCDLVAVGEEGDRQTVTTWAVPPYGYGIKGTAWDEPLYVEGGAGFPPEGIERFEIRTLDGARLASITL